MNEERENGMAIITAIGIFILMVICMLTSCSHKKKVAETVFVHDTLVVNKIDTFRTEIVRVKTDTIREVTSKEITLIKDTSSNKIDTLRIETVRDHYRYVYEGDSSAIYRVAVDSILRALDRQRDKEVVRTAPMIDWWQYLSFAVIVLGGCVAVLKMRT